MESKSDTETTQPQQSPQPTTVASSQQASKLLSIQITDENMALNVMVGFLELAQRRGTYSFEESAKILECIKKFQKMA